MEIALSSKTEDKVFEVSCKKVVNLFASKKVKVELFDKIFNGLTINKEDKEVLLTDFNSFMDESTRYRGKKYKKG